MQLSEGYVPAGPGSRPVYIVDGARTPFLKARGTPGPFRASDLAVAAGKKLLVRQPFAPGAIDEVVLGCIIPGPDEANIGRIVGLRLGCGDTTPGWTVQRNCGSGMQAIDNGAMDIATGRSDLVLAGGTESMSHAPVLLDDPLVAAMGKWMRADSISTKLKALGGLRPRHFVPVIGLLHGLTDPLFGLSMGQTAEKLAFLFDISREEMDRYALTSHERLARAQDKDLLPELETIFADDGTPYPADDGLHRDSTLDKLAGLKPAFDPPFGDITAGNSAQVTDGAAWVILASEKAVKQHNLTPLARVVDCAWAGLDPSVMGLGPVHSMAPVMVRNQLKVKDIGGWEINEAFAAQVLAALKAWTSLEYFKRELPEIELEAPFDPIPMELLNVDGGAVSLGHPVGASGARIVLHLVHVIRRKGARLGMATQCIGGGQGGAMLLENPDGSLQDRATSGSGS